MLTKSRMGNAGQLHQLLRLVLQVSHLMDRSLVRLVLLLAAMFMQMALQCYYTASFTDYRRFLKHVSRADPYLHNKWQNHRAEMAKGGENMASL